MSLIDRTAWFTRLVVDELEGLEFEFIIGIHGSRFLRAFAGVETAVLTFRTKQYSTSCSSHTCYGKRFCNDLFLNHNTVAPRALLLKTT